MRRSDSQASVQWCGKCKHAHAKALEASFFATKPTDVTTPFSSSVIR